MMGVENAERLIEYYRVNLLTENFEGGNENLALKVVVKDGADVDKCAEGAYHAWHYSGDCQKDFTGLVTSEDGSKNATFQYTGSGMNELHRNDYGITLDLFKDFWRDDVAKKFNADKEVDFEVREGVYDLQQMGKLIFGFINANTRLGSDISINLIHPSGEKFVLLVPAN